MSRNPLLQITLLAALSSAIFAPFKAEGAVEVPVFPSASDVKSQEFTGNWPPQHPIANLASAKVLKYKVPKATDPAAILAYYTGKLVKDKWVPRTPPSEFGGEKYYLYTRGADTIIIHPSQIAEGTLVEVMGLSYKNQDAPRNVSEIAKTQRLDNCPHRVHVICPSGEVLVRTHVSADVRFDVKVAGSVEYPLLANLVLQKVQLLLHSDGTGLTLGIDPDTVPSDPTVNLAYAYIVTVPTGSNVEVETEGAVPTGLTEGPAKIADGNVEVRAGVGDVRVKTAGPVIVNGATGSVSVDAGGPVTLDNLGGDIRVHTAGIWIKAYRLRLAGNVSLETNDSQVEAQLVSVKDGSFRFATSNSAIKLYIPADASADFTATAKDCQGSVAMTQVVGNTPNRWHGVLNGGKVPFELDTSGGGTVYIEKK